MKDPFQYQWVVSHVGLTCLWPWIFVCERISCCHSWPCLLLSRPEGTHPLSSCKLLNFKLFYSDMNDPYQYQWVVSHVGLTCLWPWVFACERISCCHSWPCLLLSRPEGTHPLFSCKLLNFKFFYSDMNDPFQYQWVVSHVGLTCLWPWVFACERISCFHSWPCLLLSRPEGTHPLSSCTALSWQRTPPDRPCPALEWKWKDSWKLFSDMWKRYIRGTCTLVLT